MLDPISEGAAATMPKPARSLAQSAEPNGAPAGDRPLVCIVSRGRIENVTRMPRIAKALVDAGYGVVVVALAVPIPRLRQMCPEVEYIAVQPSPWTAEVQKRWLARRQDRTTSPANGKAADREAPAEHLRGKSFRRLGRLALPLVRALARLGWLLLVMPSALLLKKKQERFGDVWRMLVREDPVRVGLLFVMSRHQRAATHAFAAAVDTATRGRRFTLVQAHDSYALVAGAKLAARDGAKLIYDAVELSSHRLGAALNLSFAERISERLQRREERRIARGADAWITVGDGLADWYAAHLGIRRPLVVRNCRHYWRYRLDERLRADAGLGPDARIVVYTGSIHPQQGIELMIGALPHLAPHIHFAVVGFAQPSQKAFLDETLPTLAASLGVAERVHFLPEQDPLDLVPYISGADIGVIPRPSEHPNNFYSMPNKFLEMIMARLPIAVSQLGDMVALVRKHQMGAVFDERDPQDTAAVISGMLDRATYAALKRHVADAAELFNWENESLPYVELVRSLTPARLTTRAKITTPARRRTRPDPSIEAVPNGRRGGLLEADQTGELAAIDQDPAVIDRHLHEIGFDIMDYQRSWRERTNECKAEAYVADGLEALLAADALAAAAGGRVYCDVAAIPRVTDKSALATGHPADLAVLDCIFAAYLSRTAGLLATGWALKERVRQYGPPVHVIPDYRRAEEMKRSTKLRDKGRLRPEDRLLWAGSPARTGLGAIIEALRLLPDNIHLAVLARPADAEGLLPMLRSVGVDSRVHCFDNVPDEQLPPLASGADLGLIALDPFDLNDRLSLPGRLFDCIAAGLPIVAPDAAPDIARIVEEWCLGVAFPGSDAPSWAAAITAALAAADGLRPNIRAAGKALVWESLADRLHAAIGNAQSVTFLSSGDVIENPRMWRMAETLAKRGAIVTICCRHRASAPERELPGVRFVTFAGSQHRDREWRSTVIAAQ